MPVSWNIQIPVGDFLKAKFIIEVTIKIELGEEMIYDYFDYFELDKKWISKCVENESGCAIARILQLNTKEMYLC